MVSYLVLCTVHPLNVPFNLSTIPFVRGWQGNVNLWSILYASHSLSTAPCRLCFHKWLCNVYSFPLSVRIILILKGKNAIAFSMNFAAVSAFLSSWISTYITLVDLSIATCIYSFFPSIFGQYEISTCRYHGSYSLNFEYSRVGFFVSHRHFK